MVWQIRASNDIKFMIYRLIVNRAIPYTPSFVRQPSDPSNRCWARPRRVSLRQYFQGFSRVLWMFSYTITIPRTRPTHTIFIANTIWRRALWVQYQQASFTKISQQVCLLSFSFAQVIFVIIDFHPPHKATISNTQAQREPWAYINILNPRFDSLLTFWPLK